MMTPERPYDGPPGNGGRPGDQRLAVLRITALAEIGREAGPETLREAKALLDRAVSTLPRREGEERDFVDHLLALTAPFIREAPTEIVRHRRLLASSHILARLLTEEAEAFDDELVSSRLEDLRERLDTLEGIEPFNPSVEARLAHIYEGLMELANAIGLTAYDQYSV